MAAIVEDAMVIKDLKAKKITIPASASNNALSLSEVASLGTENITISNVGHPSIGTATISAWMAVNSGGVIYYIPMWT